MAQAVEVVLHAHQKAVEPVEVLAAADGLVVDHRSQVELVAATRNFRVAWVGSTGSQPPSAFQPLPGIPLSVAQSMTLVSAWLQAASSSTPSRVMGWAPRAPRWHLPGSPDPGPAARVRTRRSGKQVVSFFHGSSSRSSELGGFPYFLAVMGFLSPSVTVQFGFAPQDRRIFKTAGNRMWWLVRIRASGFH